MKTTIIITVILFIYIVFSTLFHDSVLVGDIGKSIGEGNSYLFGYFSYINIFVLLYPLYTFYNDPSVRKSIDFYVGYILLFLSIIIFMSLVFDKYHIGYIGSEILLFLLPWIGTAGLWLLWLMMLSISILFIAGESLSILHIDNLKAYFSSASFLEKKEIFLRFFNQASSNPFASPPLEEEMMPRAKAKIVEKPSISKPNKHTKSLEKSLPKALMPKYPKKKPLKEDNATARVFDDLVQSPQEEEPKPKAVKKTKTVKKEKVPEEKEYKANTEVEIVQELEENSKILAEIDKGAVAKPKNFKLPRLDFLQKAPKSKKRINEAEIDRKIEELLAKLKHFKIEGDVIRTYSGPLVTTFEFKPAPHIKISKILGLQDDLAMALSAETIRIQAPIPGRDVVGIEIPNESIETIYLRDILESDIYKESSSPLTVALGKDIVGNPFITDIKKLPHLLIAGTTGSGKSVGINAMILSLLYRNDPDQLKLMLIDPKMLEFSIYNDIPHLLTPVIIEPKKAIYALANMVGEMERRYKLMADNRTKNIDNYNEKVSKDGSTDPFPFIVIVIDELADLMMNGGKEVEYSIARLAQMARASGIHLIVATQRPSVDVVTGLIKANLPSRLSYRVGQRIDSKVILDAMGAESLLGRGDGLFTPPASTGLVRIHAPWNTEDEVEEIVEFLKAQRLPEYDESYLVDGNTGESLVEGKDMVLDALYEDAKNVIINDQKTSISYLQRKLQIGYNRSANIIEQLEAQGVLTPPNAKGNREIA